MAQWLISLACDTTPPALNQLLRIMFLINLASIEIQDSLAKFGFNISINTDENNNSVCKTEKSKASKLNFIDGCNSYRIDTIQSHWESP